jgi:hypothetical protein
MQSVALAIYVVVVLVMCFSLVYIIAMDNNVSACPQPIVKIIKEPCAPCKPCQTYQQTVIDSVTERDRRVMHDDLYPPLNRPDSDSMRNMNIRPLATRGSNDTFRLIGYLVDESDKNEVWKLFARQQYTGGRAEFYATPANRNFEMKVTLDNNIITSRDKFTDIYTLPDFVNISHPMFSRNTYKVIQLQQSDFSSQYV